MKRSAFVAAAAATPFAVPSIVLAQTAKVRIGSVAVEAYALSYYAQEQGIFAHNGIDAEIQSLPGGGAITAAIVGGALDVGCASIGPMSNAFLRGIPIRAIAAGGIYTSREPTTALVVGKSSPIASARDMNGKTFGTSALRDLQEVAVLKWVDAHGGDSKTVKSVEMPIPQAAAAINAGRLDAYPLVEPFLTNQRDQIKIIGYPYDAIASRVMIGIHLAHGDWLARNPDTARRVVRSLREAAQWANGNPTQVNAVLAKISHIPPATIVRMKRVVNGESLELGAIQPQIDALADYKFIARRFSAAEMAWS